MWFTCSFFAIHSQVLVNTSLTSCDTVIGEGMYILLTGYHQFFCRAWWTSSGFLWHGNSCMCLWYCTVYATGVAGYLHVQVLLYLFSMDYNLVAYSTIWVEYGIQVTRVRPIPVPATLAGYLYLCYCLNEAGCMTRGAETVVDTLSTCGAKNRQALFWAALVTNFFLYFFLLSWHLFEFRCCL